MPASFFLLPLSLPAGVSLADVVEVDSFEYSTATMEIIAPDGSQEQVALIGSSEMRVFFEGASEGDAIDHNGNGRDEVATELAILQISGQSLTWGTVMLDLSPEIPSLGDMEEQVNNTPGRLDVPPFTATGLVDSFFDVFFVIELAGIQLHNIDPMRISTVISHKPVVVGETYESLQDIQLYDADGSPSGFWVGAASYDFVPEPQSGLMIAVAALAALARYRRRHELPR